MVTLVNTSVSPLEWKPPNTMCPNILANYNSEVSSGVVQSDHRKCPLYFVDLISGVSFNSGHRIYHLFVTINHVLVLGQVTDVKVTAVNSTAVEVSWTRLQSNDISFYRVTYSQAGSDGKNRRQNAGENHK